MLWKLTTTNKYGNLRSRIVYNPDGKPFTIGRGFGKFVHVQVFKYTYEHPLLPPSLFVGQDGKKYIVPTWQEVLPETTLNDINWVKPKPSVKKIENPNEWKFESKSDPGSYYVVTQVSDFKVKCTCTGQYRAKDRKCRHMKEVMAELGIK